VRHLSKLEMSPKPKWYSADTFDEPPYMLSGAFEERNYHMGMHMHDFYEICLVLDGFTVHHTENGTADADAGMIFIIPPGILHGFEKCAERWLEEGGTHHEAVTLGDTRVFWKMLAKMLGITYCEI